MDKLSPIEAYLHQLVDHFADRVAAQLAGARPAKQPAAPKAARKSRLRGKKLDMSCRVAGCKNKSRGPRFGFICDEHRKKLSAKEQAAAREAWKEKRKAV